MGYEHSNINEHSIIIYCKLMCCCCLHCCCHFQVPLCAFGVVSLPLAFSQVLRIPNTHQCVVPCCTLSSCPPFLSHLSVPISSQLCFYYTFTSLFPESNPAFWRIGLSLLHRWSRLHCGPWLLFLHWYFSLSVTLCFRLFSAAQSVTLAQCLASSCSPISSLPSSLDRPDD